MSVAPKLADVLFHTAHVIREVLAGHSLTNALLTVPIAQKPAVQSISFYCCRHLHSAQALSALLLAKKAPNPLVNALLLVSLSLLTVPKRGEMTEGTPYYQAFTVVDETLKAAQKHKKMQAFKSLLNACLRRYLREQDRLWAQIQQTESVRLAYPQWWIDLMKKAYPEQWEAILQAGNIAGPLSLRVNRRRCSQHAFSELLTAANMPHVLYGQEGIILDKAVPVNQIPQFEQGWCAVQDVGAQKVADILPLQTSWRVLDACAAPGGKTAHLLEREDIEITALDIDPLRLKKVEENLKHLGLYHENVHLCVADASETAPWWDGKLFDVVLADVPCTASGVVRRHPDIKHLRQYADVAKTAKLQRKIVENLWTVLKEGGYFLYITCSVFPQEGEEQAQFIENHLKGAVRLAVGGQLLPLPEENADRALHDGFFYALFQKKET